MTSILFVTWDGGGNVPPTLAVARQLRHRGHAVRVLGHPAQRDTVEGAGLPFEAYRRARNWSPVARVGGSRQALGYLRLFTDRTIGAELVDALRREPADVVVVDCLLLGALGAARRLGVRHVALVHTRYDYVARTWAGGPIGLLGRLKGLPPRRLLDGADRALVLSLPELEPDRLLPANVRIVGPAWPAGWSPPDPRPVDEPRILVSLSSIHYPGQTATLQAVADAVAELPVPVVLTTGHSVDPGELRLPANVDAHRFVPHSALLPTVSLVVGHAGHSTTMQALAHDLPMVLMPMLALGDQPGVAKAVQQHGAVTTLARTAAPAEIRAALRRMLADGPHRAAAARLGGRIRQADGAVTAAREIEDIAGATRRSAAPA